MDVFFKSAAMAVVCVILYLALSKDRKEFATVLSITACCFLAAAAFGFLDSVMDFVHRLIAMANLNTETVQILLKSTGISILSEFCAMICTDAGNSALGKGIQLLAAATVLWLSLPLFMNLLDLVTNLLSNV